MYFVLFLGCRYHGLYSDLQRVTIDRIQMFRHGGGDRIIYSAPTPRWQLLIIETVLAEPPIGMKLSCCTKPETTSTRVGADKDHGAAVQTAVTIENNKVRIYHNN